MRRTWAGWVAAALAGSLGLAACGARQPAGLTVAAASSLAPVMTAVADELRAETGLETVVVLGASVDLAQQIHNGAPFDVFLTADPALLDSLETDGLLDGPPVDVALGRLSIALAEGTRTTSPPSLEMLAHPEIERVVIADPEHAPFGAAARRALQAVGLWDTLQPKLVFSGSALQALEALETGNAQAGLVPTSLLAGRSLASAPVPDDLYDAVHYSAGVIRGSSAAESDRFLEALRSPAGRRILEASGLIPAGEP